MTASKEAMPISLLLIEDDLIDQKAFMFTVRDLGLNYNLTAVFSIAEARLALANATFDLIVSDYLLGDGTAFDLLAIIDHTPIILVTGMGDEEIAVRALKAGAADYLVKDHDRNYLKLLPLAVETILQRRQLEINEREQRILASALHDTALALTSTLELNEVLDRILFNVRKVLPHDRANIMLIESGSTYIVQYSDGYPVQIQALRFPIAVVEQFTWMYKTQEPCLIADATTVSDQVYFSDIDRPASYLAAPLIADDEVIGFINLDSREKDCFIPVYAVRLQAFAAQAAIAIENARLYQQNMELAAIQERQRIARDLHDSVTQTLFSATIMSSTIIALWRQNPAQVESELLELHDVTRGALAEMRTLLFELRPDILASAQLGDLFRQLIDTLRGRSRLDIEFTMQPRELPLPVPVKTAFFHIMQEALNNIIKHAHAQRVRIDFRRENSRILLSVIDDGCGFESSSELAGFGLQMMRERAQLAGMTFLLNSNPNNGTEITVGWQPPEGAK
jgi:signal transduction histidine kinase/FixJ family two-component response regulator